jgi:YHS domain-containing protein
MRYLLEIFSWVLLFLLLRSVLRNFMAGYRRPREGPRDRGGQQAPLPTGGELKKDPVCGTYVFPSASVTRTVNGQVIYFCSPQCRDRYEAS